jgi:hypothetical protein
MIVHVVIAAKRKEKLSKVVGSGWTLIIIIWLFLTIIDELKLF